MTRRRTGFAFLIFGFVLLVLVVDFDTATRVQLLAAGLVGAIVFTYYRGEALFGWKLGAGVEPAPELLASEPTGGVFDTDLSVEALNEPIIEQPIVSLSRGAVLEAETSSLVTTVVSESEDLGVDEAPVPEAEELQLGAETPSNQMTALFNHEVEHRPTPAASSPIFRTTEPAETALVADGENASDQPVFIEMGDYTGDELISSVKAGEASLISVLTESGLLSSEGPLTDTDVHTMVFVAVSSDDLLRVLLEGKAADAEAKALRHDITTPELYQPAVELMESHP